MRWIKTFESFELNVVKKISDICEKYKWESTHIILKNQIKIGEYNYDDVVCYDVYNNNEGICALAYYTKDNGKRGTEFIFYNIEDNGSSKFMMDGSYDYFDEMDVGFSMYDDAVELILNELETCGEEWLIYQRDLQQACRDWQRKATQGKINDDDRSEFGKNYYELESIKKERTI